MGGIGVIGRRGRGRVGVYAYGFGGWCIAWHTASWFGERDGGREA